MVASMELAAMAVLGRTAWNTVDNSAAEKAAAEEEVERFNFEDDGAGGGEGDAEECREEEEWTSVISSLRTGVGEGEERMAIEDNEDLMGGF